MAFNNYLQGNTQDWTNWKNPPADAPQTLEQAQLPPPRQRGSLKAFETSALPAAPLKQWIREDVQSQGIKSSGNAEYQTYEYYVDEVLVLEYHQKYFYYHDIRSNTWINFLPVKDTGVQNVVEGVVVTADKLPDDEVRKNWDARRKRIADFMIGLSETHPQKYAEILNKVARRDPKMATFIRSAVLSHDRHQGGLFVLGTAAVIAAPLIIEAAVFSYIETATFVQTNAASIRSLITEISIETVVTEPLLTMIEAQTGIPISTILDVKDAKGAIADLWKYGLKRKAKEIDEAVETVAEKMQKGDKNPDGTDTKTDADSKVESDKISTEEQLKLLKKQKDLAALTLSEEEWEAVWLKIDENGFRALSTSVEAGTKNIKNFLISKEGIEKVEKYLALFDKNSPLSPNWSGQWAHNAIMIKRLKQIEAGKMKAEKVDLYFYSHELTETDLMEDYLNVLQKSNLDETTKFERAYAKSHAETCKMFNVKANDKNLSEEGHFYTKEALKAVETK